MHRQRDDASVNGLARQRLSQRIEVFGKNGHHIYEHGSVQLQQTLGRVDLDDLIDQRHRRHNGADERDQHLTGLGAHRQQFTRRGVQHLGDGAHVYALGGAYLQPFELMVVELVGILDGWQIPGIEEEQGASQGVGGVAVGNPVEPDQQATTVLARGVHDESAFRASLFYIFFPTSLFLTAVYSESFFIAALAGSFYLVEQNRLIPAVISAAILMLTRPQGALALPFLVWLGFQRFEKNRITAACAILFVSLVSLASYFWYIQQTFGSVRWILDSQNYWRGEMKYPFYGLVRFAQSRVAIHGQHNSIIDFSFAVFQIFVLLLSIRKLPAPYWLFSLLVIAIPLSSSTFSFSRLCLANFPFFLYLGYRLTGRLAFMAQMAFALLLSFFTAAFSNWYWVG